MLKEPNKKTGLSVGIIMDGNRRWARERGLPTLMGHKKGAEVMRECIRWADEANVEALYFYAWSTENWNRSPEEVSYIMDLVRVELISSMEEIKKKNGRVRFLGERERMAPDIQEMMNRWEKETKDGTRTVAFCISYGGRAEILEAVKKAVTSGKAPESEEEFKALMWSAGIPDPDIIIRTSGEQRTSGFLTWEGVYSELFFTDTYWPAFTKEEFFGILKEYETRERRKGK